jgi:excisionase family DNA binding protein
MSVAKEQPNTSTAEPWQTRAEVASRGRVTTRTVDEWVRQGLLPAYRVGPRRVVFKTADVEAMFQPLPSDH